MQQLEEEIKALIIECLNLEDIEVSDIDSQEMLFGDGLGLDSIDALELGLALKKKYNIVLNADDAESRKHFASVHSLAQLITASN
ncbi:acyl carrier protein [Sinobacterium caligoides]|uniref:Acyl carrier protein n=1 Tax=Sinobacterium caligoides TaxID=933926 RepID=A0A3N2DP67_9GAMM|nr:phosphopantetheine-binding protein [Sinobacterium caligoides]ROS01590.1 acyl carrier protein [Sinobacterium caligoides]